MTMCLVCGTKSTDSRWNKIGGCASCGYRDPYLTTDKDDEELMRRVLVMSEEEPS